VNDYREMTETAARAKIKADGFAPVVNHHFSRTTAFGLVFMQQPGAGSRIAKGSNVTIWVSTGVPKIAVPTLVGLQEADALAALKEAHLKVHVVTIQSNKPANQVTASDPPVGTKVAEGTVVRINVAKGPTPVQVPDVRGQPLASAHSTLLGAGFKVSDNFVDSNQPANTVVDESPAPGGTAPQGSTISLTVSRGPATSPLPDVRTLDLGSATQTLQSAGFTHWKVTYQTVTDPNADGVVLAEDPQPGTPASPSTVIKLTVGKLGSATTTAETTTAATTTTTTP
jgi:serine/threonine-protein kinase